MCILNAMDKLTRAQRAERTKNHIYTTALQLFQKNNYEKVTINQICREAGVSVGNFYHYFASKEEVLMVKYLEFDDHLEELDLTRDVVDCILDIIYLQAAGAEEIGSRVFVKMMEIHLDTNGKYVAASRRLNSILRCLAQRGLDEGVFSPSHTAKEISETILRTCRGTLFDWSLRDAPYDLISVSRHDTMVVLNSFLRN